ncbi:hypothetical protein BaRGS_00017374 [Batillaria attramentaria]|uniref:Uncharacterized protein n=1 Tax=Batillaria attramentaria TaxID=370345 RepID=A0ABD0KVR3_9CAEN
MAVSVGIVHKIQTILLATGFRSKCTQTLPQSTTQSCETSVRMLSTTVDLFFRNEALPSIERSFVGGRPGDATTTLNLGSTVGQVKLQRLSPRRVAQLQMNLPTITPLSSAPRWQKLAIIQVASTQMVYKDKCQSQSGAHVMTSLGSVINSAVSVQTRNAESGWVFPYMA